MTLREISNDGIHYWLGIPHYPVNLYVEYFMICHGIPSFQQEYIFPNNQAEIFFNLGDVNHAFGTDEELRLTFTRTIVSGLRSERLAITPGNFSAWRVYSPSVLNIKLQTSNFKPGDLKFEI